MRSLLLIVHDRPAAVVVQIGPSVASMTGLCSKFLLRTPYILDSHSGIFLSPTEARFHWLLRITFRNARAVLIHNHEHLHHVREMGGQPFLLEDPIPLFCDASTTIMLQLRRPAVFFPCSWRPDEPIQEVIEAARSLPHVTFYITGSPKYSVPLLENLVITGFLSPSDYLAHLQQADVVLALTSEQSISLCAAHEAIAVAKPLVSSDTRVLRERFGSAAILADAKATSIARAITAALADIRLRTAASWALRHSLETKWASRLRELSSLFPEATP